MNETTLLNRILSRIDASGDCWIWTGWNWDGYGVIQINNKQTMAHRALYERLAGHIPDGFTLDHLCRNKLCVNPDHLEPVTLRENILRGYGPLAQHARQTHCVHGHEFTAENTQIRRGGYRACKACAKATHRERNNRYLETHGREWINSLRRARHAANKVRIQASGKADTLNEAKRAALEIAL